MDAIKQIVIISSNHELKRKVNEYIAENELMEAIVPVKSKKRSWRVYE